MKLPQKSLKKSLHEKALSEIKLYAEEKANAVVIKSGCKLCNSKYRSECEDLYIETDNMTSVMKLMHSKGEEISLPAVRRHLTKHFINVSQREKMRDYAEDLSRWKEIHIEREDRMRTYLAIIEKRMFQIASHIDDMVDNDSIKSTEMVSKLIEQAFSIQKQIDEEAQRLDPARVVIQKLQEIIEIRVKTSQSVEMKNTLISLVSDLQGNIGGILEDG